MIPIDILGKTLFELQKSHFPPDVKETFSYGAVDANSCCQGLQQADIPSGLSVLAGGRSQFRSCVC